MLFIKIILEHMRKVSALLHIERREVSANSGSGKPTHAFNISL